MADTKITRLRNLLTPVKNYIAMVNADKMGKTISTVLLDKELENININSNEIWAIISEIPDDACEGKPVNEHGALPIPDVSISVCSCLHPRFNPITDRCLVCNKPYKIQQTER